MYKTDPYLTSYKAKYRLLREYKVHNMLVVAYDFDNTVYDYHKKGWKFEKLISLLKRAKEYGCYLIVFTAAGEERYPEIIKYLKDNDIPYDAINDNYTLTNTNGRKIYYNVLLDDRAGLKQAYDDLTFCFDEIEYDKNHPEEIRHKINNSGGNKNEQY